MKPAAWERLHLRERADTVQHQQIIRPQHIQCLDQHAALGHRGAMHAGMQSQLRAGQEPGEQTLIARSGRSAQKARPHGRHQQARIGRNHPQATPALNEAGLFGAANDQIVQRDQRRLMDVIPRLDEGSIRDLAQWQGGVANRSKEAVKHGLLGLFARG